MTDLRIKKLRGNITFLQAFISSLSEEEQTLKDRLVPLIDLLAEIAKEFDEKETMLLESGLQGALAFMLAAHGCPDAEKIARQTARQLCHPVYRPHIDPSVEGDGTDAAHPAWWRGQDDGVRGATERVQHALDVDLSLKQSGTIGYQPLQEVVEQVLALRRRVEEGALPVPLRSDNDLNLQGGTVVGTTGHVTITDEDWEEVQQELKSLRAWKAYVSSPHGLCTSCKAYVRGLSPL